LTNILILIIGEVAVIVPPDNNERDIDSLQKWKETTLMYEQNSTEGTAQGAFTDYISAVGSSWDQVLAKPTPVSEFPHENIALSMPVPSIHFLSTTCLVSMVIL
jgi:hypothetical protein